MIPELLSWNECHPLPWRVDKKHGIVDAEGFPIGVGGTEAQREAFCLWLGEVVELVKNLQAPEGGNVEYAVENGLYGLEVALDGEKDEDPVTDEVVL